MSVQVQFLGTGDAFNARGQCHACHMVRTPRAIALLDCGPTSLLALKREGLTAADVDHIFLSHLHGDHFAGLPFLLIANVYDSPRTRPLHVVGPPGTEQRIMDLYRAMYPDISQRPLPFALECTETAGNETLDFYGISVRGFPVPHQDHAISLGLKVAAEGKNVLYSGDTGWTEALVDQSRDTDLFICECCFFESRMGFHLDYPRIAENRDRFGCKRLILTHIGREVAARLDEVECEISSDRMAVEV